jgi:hypothetical protein
MNHGDELVFVESSIIEGESIRAVSWLPPEQDWDSGFALFASEPGQVGDTDVMCLSCALDEWPDIGRGLDLAREHGEAIFSTGKWSAS